MAECLELGDNFVVNVEEGNEEGVEFHVVLSTTSTHFEVGLYMSLGHLFQASDVVVAGTYYQKWGTREKTYVLLHRSHIIYLYVSHVQAIKFCMLPTNHRVSGNEPVYTLLEYALVGIM